MFELIVSIAVVLLIMWCIYCVVDRTTNAYYIINEFKYYAFIPKLVFITCEILRVLFILGIFVFITFVTKLMIFR